MYNRINKEYERIQEKMKSFIIQKLLENNNEIYLSINEDEKYDSDLYPVRSILYGRHVNPPIHITKIYLQNETILADGLDEEWNQMSGFKIYPEQYPDVFYFIGNVLDLN